MPAKSKSRAFFKFVLTLALFGIQQKNFRRSWVSVNVQILHLMTDYNKLTVVKLKEELEKRGLPKTGLKAALVERLNEADAQAASVSADSAREVPDQPEAAQKVDTASIIQSNDGIDSSTQVLAIVPPSDKIDNAPEKEDPLTPKTVSPSESGKLEEPIQQPIEVDINHDQHVLGIDRPETAIDTAATEVKELSKIQDAAPTLPDFATTPERSQTVQESGTATAQASKETSVNREEILEDSRKRKRRSQSPPPSSIDAAQKKAKAQDGSPIVRLREDTETEEPAPSPTKAETVSRDALTDDKTNGKASKEEEEHIVKDEVPSRTGERRGSTIHETLPSPSKMSPTDTRFKNLFPAPSKDLPTSKQDSYQDLEDRDIPPALHPATSSLYIRNFSRPLHPGNLKEHLASLARPAHSSPAPEIITDFFLDTIKTHCLVRFSTVAAASRVRSALHDRVWPEERTRKPLWVDFAPEEKLQKWIEVEQGAGGSRGQPGKRWEVVYEQEDGKIAAYLQETDGTAAARPSISNGPRMEAGMGVQGAPSGPRITDARSQLPPTPRADTGKGFKALDDLFKSTTAKPKLYFLPVIEAIANRRLDKLAAGRGGGRSDEMRRFTFEDEVIVDRGPEFGSGWRGGLRGRGGYSGGYSGRGGGGYRGGRGGDSWRDGR